jgi:hypothetical protein
LSLEGSCTKISGDSLVEPRTRGREVGIQVITMVYGRWTVSTSEPIEKTSTLLSR